MRTKLLGLCIGLMAVSAGAYAQQGELVNLNESAQKSYYTNNSEYTFENDGSYTGDVVSYYDNGQIEEMGAITANNKEGYWNRYDQAGNKIAVAQYRQGMKHGTWKVWSSEGVLRVVMEYDKGKRVGTWKFYDDNGNITEEKSLD